ncbi:MAG: cbb3-type cytochrome c oxidase subunit II [Deltaproteobacteria bacterium]|nr:cbb3-type cytochrome c oxidase subunit II [Deltaproteobacteria bacterium]
MLEKKPIIFLLIATGVILIGTVVTMIAPFKWINDPKLKIAEVKPYTPLQLEGRDLYIREGCNNCHTQTVRPLLADVERYGDYSKAGEFVYDQPHLWGSRRTGPDLARIGGKYPDAWHYKHMADPQSMVPRSNMPKYAFMQRPLDASLAERKMKALGFPYSQAELDALKGKSEMDAMVAYLQKLGNDIPWRKAARTTVAGDIKNPFRDDRSVLAEGKSIYDKECAQCHGNDLKGGVGPSLADLKQSEADMFKIVFSGSPAGGMPAFGDILGKERVWKVVTYLKSRGH